jgi:hypothetical protein
LGDDIIDFQENQLEHVERLRESASNTGQHVRTVYLTFLLLCTYIGVIIGSTIDVQLLRVEPVTLPLLNVQIPIVGFYSFVPWLLVFLHFNLLLQLYLLSRTLHRLNGAVENLKNPVDQAELRARLFPFHFSHLLAGRHKSRIVRLLLAIERTHKRENSI